MSPYPCRLYKTTIVIFSEFNPENYDIDDLALEATEGDAVCTEAKTELIANPSLFPKEIFKSLRNEVIQIEPMMDSCPPQVQPKKKARKKTA
jgi:hypothetical protein